VLLVDRLAITDPIDHDGRGEHQPSRLSRAAGDFGEAPQQVDCAAEVGVVEADRVAKGLPASSAAGEVADPSEVPVSHQVEEAIVELTRLGGHPR
jgi:hypothetical protein